LSSNLRGYSSRRYRDAGNKKEEADLNQNERIEPPPEPRHAWLPLFIGEEKGRREGIYGYRVAALVMKIQMPCPGVMLAEAAALVQVPEGLS